MDAIECILTRKSVREFSNKSVPQKALDTMIACARAAPSARNEQPWHFVIVTDRITLDTVAKIHPNGKMSSQAQAGILVCADLTKLKTEGYWPQDCSAAAMNILLSAHALGLGAVWTGIYPRNDRVKAFQELFKLSDNIVPFCFIPLGYPMEKESKKEK